MMSSSSTSLADVWSTLSDPARRAAVDRLPAAFARFAAQPEQMAAGAPGKVGFLEMRFEAAEGRTQLTSQYASGPQRVHRALYLDPELAGMAFVLIQSVGGGILQGDRLAVAITVCPEAQAHVTTQSATKLYRMERNFATQRFDVRVEPGAYLELLPDYVIPYRNARLYHEANLAVAQDATLVYSEALASGRAAHGERFVYDLLFTRVVARDLAGRLRFVDSSVLEPGRLDPRRMGLLGHHTDLGSLYVLTKKVGASELAGHLHARLQGVPGVTAGASQLPGGDGAMVRVLGDGTRAVAGALHRAWRGIRELILQAGVPKVHTIKYGQELGAEKEGEQ